VNNAKIEDFGVVEKSFFFPHEYESKRDIPAIQMDLEELR